MRALAIVAALAAALAAGGCGPYAELAQKLDVGAVIVGGETWISTAPSASGEEVRVLLLGDPPAAGGRAGFAFTAITLDIAAGRAVWSTQGDWPGDPAAPTLELHERLLYQLDDQRGTKLLERSGATRQDVNRTVTLGQSRADGRLVLTGDASMAGTYVLLPAALAARGSSTVDDAACAFQLANLAVLSSQARIIGFGGVGMTQYSEPESFVGTVAGDVRVALSHKITSPTTDITYTGFTDFAGVAIAGTQTTRVDTSGDGSMSGTVTFSLQPEAPLPAITGTILYGPGDDAIQISSGFASGGRYVVTLDGGGTARVDPVGAPSPSVSQCLGLSPP